MASSSLKMTYDFLKENQVLAMQNQIEEPIPFLSPTERFYTDGMFNSSARLLTPLLVVIRNFSLESV